MKRCLFGLSLLAVFAILFALPAAADNLYASIRGTVTDQTGAVIAGVKVTVTNTATGIDYQANTNKDGLFVFPQVPIGDYRARIEQTGFKAFQQSGIHVDLNQVYSLDVKLVVGAASEEVVVEANPVQVETTSMQQGTVVSGSQIVDMPLNGRDWTQLQQLEPGVVAESDRFNAYSTNGSGAQQNSFLINGTDTNDVAINTHLVSPSPDAIGEFNMVTSTINPEFGRNSGAIINATIKNGTNQFHGDGFEFYRDTFLDAANFTENNNPDRPCGTNTIEGDCRTPFHRNQYGGTIGGPIVKDKAFFFFSYQGLHERAPQVGYGSTPVFSPAELGGDFSASGLAFGTNPIPYNMYGDSASPCPVSGGSPCVAGATNPATGNPYAFSDLFSTGVVPSQNFDALAVKLVNQYVPAAGNASSCNNNTITCLFTYNPSFTETDNQYLYRIDYKFRQNDSIWGYGMYETEPTNNTIPFVGANLPGFGDHSTEHTQQYTVAWNHTFSPTTLNEARFGYLRFNFQAVLPNNIVNPTAYGFTGLVPQTTQYNSLPVMNVTGLFDLGFSSDGPQPRVQNTYHFTDNFSKVIGHHTMKAGFTAEILQLNNPFYSNLYGTYDFNASGPYSSGIPGADFLLGLPSTYEQGSGAYIRGRGREFYTYFQDQWQIRPTLTLTLGAGWDIETPWKNITYGGETMVAWRPGQQSTRYPSMPAGFVYPGDAGINQYGGPTVHYDDIGPRAGFAWSPWGNHNWSIRGGIGLYFNRSEEELILQGLANPPFALSTSGGQLAGQPVFESPMNGYVAGAPGTITNPIYDATGVTQPYPYYAPAAGASFNPALFYPIGYNWNAQDPHLTAPRSTNFNLTVQRQLDKATILSVGYVGSIGRHEEGAVDANQAGVYPGTNAAAVAAGCPSGLYLPFCASGVANGNTPYPISVYGQPGIQATGWNSNYNSMQVGLNRRFSQGLQLLASYTWSRYFDESSSFENSSFNGPGTSPWGKAGRAQMYAPSASDAPQRLVLSWTYTLPFYKLAHRARRLTDDWNVSGIYTLQHGFPVPVFDFWSHSVTCDVAGYAFYYCPDRPNAIGRVNIINPRTTAVDGAPPAWFTNGASAFTNGCPGNVISSACGSIIPGYTGAGIGTAIRNPFYGPGLNYGDIALEKNVHIDESKYFQFRLETFNTFNHTNFCPPANWGACGATPTNDASFLDASTFGQIFGSPALSTNGEGRVLQLGAKFFF
jgi:Carboxypeptidase regulatory-like domain